MRFFYSEIVKNLKLWHWQLLLVIFVGYTYVHTHSFATNPFSAVIISKADPISKNAYFVFFRLYLPKLSLPLIIGLLCYASILFMEERQNMWLLHGTSNYYKKLHFAKLLSIYTFLVVFISLHYLATVSGIKQYFHYLPIEFTKHKPQYFIREFWLMLKYTINTLGFLGMTYCLVLFWPLKKYRLVVALLAPYIISSFVPKQINPTAYIFETNSLIHNIRRIEKAADYFEHISLIGRHEIISLSYTTITFIVIWCFSNKYKYLFFK